MKNLRWIQSPAAGPNDVINAGFDISKIALTTGSGLHDYTVAEHTSASCSTPPAVSTRCATTSCSRAWPGHLGGPQPDRPAGAFTTLRDARVLVWGFGNIAKNLVPHLTALGAHVKGVARSAGVRNGIEIYGEDKLPELLPETDALVTILPGDPSTHHAINAERLKLHCPSTPGSLTWPRQLHRSRRP